MNAAPWTYTGVPRNKVIDLAQKIAHRMLAPGVVTTVAGEMDPATDTFTMEVGRIEAITHVSIMPEGPTQCLYDPIDHQEITLMVERAIETA